MGKRKTGSRSVARDLEKLIILGEVVLVGGAVYLVYKFAEGLTGRDPMLTLKILTGRNTEEEFVEYYFGGDWAAYQKWKDDNALGDWIGGRAFKAKIYPSREYGTSKHAEEIQEKVLTAEEDTAAEEESKVWEMGLGPTLPPKDRKKWYEFWR